MSFAENGNGNMVMPVSPMYGGYGGNGGFGFGGDGSWWVILFLFAMMGGWGNGFGGFGGGNGAVPYINNDVQRGFDQSAVMNGINGLTSAVNTGFGNVQTSLCNGFAGVNQGVANGFAQAEIAANARQMADMQQAFALQSALQNCCCENRAATADLKYTVATENCMDRTQSAQNTRDIIDSQSRGTQAILDKLCALELDNAKSQIAAEQRENANLRSELMYARGQASQVEQNAFISQGFANEVDALYNRLNSCPVPTTPVYGRTPIFTCNNNGYGYGCGCGA